MAAEAEAVAVPVLVVEAVEVFEAVAVVAVVEHSFAKRRGVVAPVCKWEFRPVMEAEDNCFR